MDYTTIITALGLGGVIGALVKHWLDNKQKLNTQLNQINEEKYRILLIHMSCALDINNRKYFPLKKIMRLTPKNII